MTIIWRTQEVLSIVALLLVIAGLIGLYHLYKDAKRGEVRLIVTRWQALPTGGYSTEYALAWGREDGVREAVSERAARKVAESR